MEKPSFITNRNIYDVNRWELLREKGWAHMTKEERKEWLGEIETTPAATKGMYTHNDLNRVEKAVGLILQRFQEAGYETPEMEIKTNWVYRDKVTKADMERYLHNISILREFLIVFPDTPTVPSIDARFDYKQANNIEKILKDVYSVADSLIRSRYYVGEIISGEV